MIDHCGSVRLIGIVDAEESSLSVPDRRDARGHRGGGASSRRRYAWLRIHTVQSLRMEMANRFIRHGDMQLTATCQQSWRVTASLCSYLSFRFVHCTDQRSTAQPPLWIRDDVMVMMSWL